MNRNIRRLSIYFFCFFALPAFCGCTVSRQETPSASSADHFLTETPAETVTASGFDSRAESCDTPDGSDGGETRIPAGETAAPSAYTVSADLMETAAQTALPSSGSTDPDNIIDLSTALYTYDKLKADLSWFASHYPQYMTLETAGTTADGRSLFVVYFGNRNASRQIFICAATHAREYMTAQLVMKQLEYYCAHYESGDYNGIPYRTIFGNTCFVLVPMVNPDGVSISQSGEAGLNRQDLREQLKAIYASDISGGFTDLDYDTYLVRWKANGAGVDLNRNYSPGWDSVTDRTAPSFGLYKGAFPGSEPESAALMALIDSLSNPLLAVSYHSYGDLVYWQYGQPEPLWTANSNLAAHISNLTGHSPAGYSNEAGFSNWCVIERGIPSVTVETGTVPCPLPLDQFADLWERHRDMWAMLGTVY